MRTSCILPSITLYFIRNMIILPHLYNKLLLYRFDPLWFSTGFLLYFKVHRCHASLLIIYVPSSTNNPFLTIMRTLESHKSYVLYRQIYINNDTKACIIQNGTSPHNTDWVALSTVFMCIEVHNH